MAFFLRPGGPANPLPGGNQSSDLATGYARGGLVRGWQGGGYVDDDDPDNIRRRRETENLPPDIAPPSPATAPRPPDTTVDEPAGSSLKRVLKRLYDTVLTPANAAEAQPQPPKTGYADTPAGFAPTDAELADMTAPPRRGEDILKTIRPTPAPATGYAPTDVELAGTTAKPTPPQEEGWLSLLGRGLQRSVDLMAERRKERALEPTAAESFMANQRAKLEDFVNGGNGLPADQMLAKLNHEEFIRNPPSDFNERINRTFKRTLTDEGDEAAGRFVQGLRPRHQQALSLASGALAHGEGQHTAQFLDLAHNLIPNDRKQTTQFDPSTGHFTVNIVNTVTGDTSSFRLSPQQMHDYVTGIGSQFDHSAHGDTERILQHITDPTGASALPANQREISTFDPDTGMIRTDFENRLTGDKYSVRMSPEQHDKWMNARTDQVEKTARGEPMAPEAQMPRSAIPTDPAEIARNATARYSPATRQAETERNLQIANNLNQRFKIVKDYQDLVEAAKPREVKPYFLDPRIAPVGPQLAWGGSEKTSTGFTESGRESRSSGATRGGSRSAGSEGYSLSSRTSSESSKTPHWSGATPGMEAHVVRNEQAERDEAMRVADAKRELVRFGLPPQERPDWHTDITRPLPPSVSAYTGPSEFDQQRALQKGGPRELPEERAAREQETARIRTEKQETPEQRAARDQANIGARTAGQKEVATLHETAHDARQARWLDARSNRQVRDYVEKRLNIDQQGQVKLIDRKLQLQVPLTKPEQTIYDQLMTVHQSAQPTRQTPQTAATQGPVRVTSLEEASRLPSGTQFIDPDGNLRTRP